jgi:predicted dehydrogenase
VPGFRSEGWEVAAICSRTREKAQKAAAEAAIDGVYTDPMDLIRRDDLAAVSIITPPGGHHSLSIAALQAGKHVLCEKPFAIDAKQARQMLDTAEKSRRTAMVAHEFRHTPQRAYIKQLLDEGYIGKFQLCTIELFLDRYVSPQPRPFTWMARNPKAEGCSALGSHYIDGLRYWFGEVAP